MAISTVSGLARATGVGEHHLQQLGVESQLLVPISEYLKLIEEYNRGLFHRVTALLARGPQLQQRFRKGVHARVITSEVAAIDSERKAVAAELHQLRERVELVVTRLKTFAVSVPGYVEKLKRQKRVVEDSLGRLDLQINDKQRSSASAAERIKAIDRELSGKKRERDRCSNEHDKVYDNIGSLQDERSKKESRAEASKGRLNDAEWELEEAQDACKEPQEEARHWEENLRTARSNLSYHKSRLAQLRKERGAIGFLDFSEKSDKDDEIETEKGNMSSSELALAYCIAIKRDRDATLARAKQRVNVAQAKIRSAKSALLECEKSIHRIDARIGSKFDEAGTREANISDCERSILRLEEEKGRLVAEINRCNTHRQSDEEKRLQSSIAELSQVIGRLAVFSFSQDVVAHFAHIERVLSSELGTTLVRVRSGVEDIQGKFGGPPQGLASCIDAFAKLCVKEEVAALPSIDGTRMLRY